jgi:hypothetical protein
MISCAGEECGEAMEDAEGIVLDERCLAMFDLAGIGDLS